MKKVMIEKIIANGESETLELKPSLSQMNEIIETISALANTKGGEIIIGVSDSGKIRGVEIGKGTIENLTNTIAQNTEPKIQPHIKIEKIEGKNIIVIDVTESMDKLVLAFGRPYKKVGKSSPRMSKEEYEKRILEKHKEKIQFDKQICKEATLKDFDWNYIKEKFIPLYERLSEKKITGNLPSLIKSLNCIRDGKPTNAGILLFGKEPQNFYMNAYIALARYKGKEVETQRLDYKEFTGNLFQQVDECDKYIKEHITIMSRLLPDRIQREDIPEYGWYSVRELVTNAVCHRDYADFGSKVIIKMFSNKIEFYNPGGLPEDITPQNIADKQYSKNPIIAKILAKVKYIEELGEGWDKIIKEHKEHTLKPRLTKIQGDSHSVLVTVFSAKEKFEEKKIELTLTERQKKIMEYLRNNQRITTSACAKLLDISNDTVLRELTSLKLLNIIGKKGIGKATYYFLKMR